MKTRIEFVQMSSGYCWFVDAWISGGWKNCTVHKTEDEAKEQAAEISRG